MTFKEWMFGDGEPDESADPTGIVREAWQAGVEATVDYLWRMWWGEEAWDYQHRGPLTANALWSEINKARDREKASAVTAERERCAIMADMLAEGARVGGHEEAEVAARELADAFRKLEQAD